ncbi:hypothetical protein NECID01_1453 [Nematocida sp. AWRm77]|nr:hypothetical protein NECID01_1453 [Nematocida sp. AWRm77]
MLLVFFLKTLFIGGTIIACSVGFVAGLYKSIHFIEEYPNRAKERIQFLIYAVCGLHIVLLFRGISIFLLGFSLLCEFLFYNLLLDYPNIETSGAGFISALIMTFINHIAFLSTMVNHKFGLLEIVFYFIVIVWAVPFSFILSLTANDNIIALPGAKKPIRRTIAGKVIDALLSRNSVWEDR